MKPNRRPVTEKQRLKIRRRGPIPEPKANQTIWEFLMSIDNQPIKARLSQEKPEKGGRE